jgi:hypothetical protein
MTETPVKTREEKTQTETVTVVPADEKKAADAPVTIGQVFDLPKEGKTDPQPDRWKVVEERVKKEVKDVKFPAALHDLGPKICELFNVPLPDVMVTSWKKVGGLQALLEKSRNSPDEVMYLELAQHAINSEHKPHLEMRIKDLPVKKIEFLVKLAFNLKGFVLKVKAGAIQEIQTGACEVKGTISYAGNVIVEKKLTPIKLPGTVRVPAALGLFQPPAPPQVKAATAT